MPFWVEGLPPGAMDAATRFHGDVLPRVLVALQGGEDLVLIFPPADHTHRGWRLAVIQQLARDAAPVRINAVVSDDEAAITAATAYLAEASGVTGQLLALDGNGAAEVLSAS